MRNMMRGSGVVSGNGGSEISFKTPRQGRRLADTVYATFSRNNAELGDRHFFDGQIDCRSERLQLMRVFMACKYRKLHRLSCFGCFAGGPHHQLSRALQWGGLRSFLMISRWSSAYSWTTCRASSSRDGLASAGGSTGGFCFFFVMRANGPCDDLSLTSSGKTGN